MRILSANVEGFGVWSGLKLESLADRMTVLYGPNEAGKTTLLEFLRSMLYGFSGERSRRYLPPVHGGRTGGSLVVSGSAGRFTISRHVGGASGESEVRVVSTDGALQPDGLLKNLLGGVDEATFNQVFAVGLREMQELGTLSDTAAAELLYDLSVGVNGLAFADRLRELSAERQRLVSPDKQRCELGQLLTRRERIGAEIDEFRAQIHRQAAIVHELGEVKLDIDRTDTERRDLDRTTRCLEAALAVREPWEQRADLTRQLATLPPLAAVPTGAVERLDVINESLEVRRRRMVEIVRARRELRSQAAALDFNHKLARHASRIEALAEQETWLKTLETHIEQLSSRIATVESEIGKHCQELGLDARRAAVARALNADAIKRLRPAARALAKHQARIRSARREEAVSNQQAEALAAKICDALRDRKETELSPALERAGNLVAQLRRRVQLDERLSQLARHETELADQGRLLLDRQLMPAWVLIGLGAVFVCGVVLVLANMFLPSSLVGSAGWLLAAIGAVGAAGAAGGKFLLDRAATNQLEACQKQAAILASQIKQAKEERESLDAQLPRGGGPLLVRLQTAEKDLASLEELLGIESQRQAALAAAQAAHSRIAAADARRREARRRWEQALVSAGLPKNVRPKAAREFASRSNVLAELRAQQEQQYGELQQRQSEYDLLTGRIEHLLRDVALQPASDRPIERLKQLTAELAAHQVVATQRESLHQRSTKLRRQQTRLAAAVRRGRQRQQQLLQEASASSEAELRQRAAEHQRRQALADRRDQLTHVIATALSGRLTEDEVCQWLEGPHTADLDARSLELNRHISQLTRQLQTLHEKRGRLEQEAAALVEDRQIANRRVELDIVDEQIRQVIERWRAITVAEATLDGVRRTYETERQPEALKEASGYLHRLTSGRYTRVWAPFGERSLRVDDRDGRSLCVEVLSRGTREQLFLGLRLALVASYARRGIELPLVLDDVLVNFDAARAKAAAAVLRDFADAGHQVLVFTCHEHLWKMFRQLKITAQELPGNDDSDAITVVYPRQTEESATHDEPEHEVARTWLPEPADDGMIELAEDDADEYEPIKRPKPKRRRKSTRKKAVQEDDKPAAKEPDERPHRVTVVRGNQLQHPFADTNWHEPVDDDSEEESDVDHSPESADFVDDTAPFDVEVEGEAMPGDELFYQDSDDWHTPDDENEAA